MAFPDYLTQTHLPVSVDAGDGRDIIGVYAPRIPFPCVEQMLEDRIDADTPSIGPVDVARSDDQTQRLLGD